MCKFKVGDVAAVKDGDDHPSLDVTRRYKVTEVGRAYGTYFVKTDLTGAEFFSEGRFVFGKAFKGNK